jgi:hypothetical protein
LEISIRRPFGRKARLLILVKDLILVCDKENNYPFIKEVKGNQTKRGSINNGK